MCVPTASPLLTEGIVRRPEVWPTVGRAPVRSVPSGGSQAHVHPHGRPLSRPSAPLGSCRLEGVTHFIPGRFHREPGPAGRHAVGPGAALRRLWTVTARHESRMVGMTTAATAPLPKDGASQRVARERGSALSDDGIDVRAVDSAATVRGGSAPGVALPRAVLQVLLESGRAAASERGFLTGNSGGVSKTRLVLDPHGSQRGEQGADTEADDFGRSGVRRGSPAGRHCVSSRTISPLPEAGWEHSERSSGGPPVLWGCPESGSGIRVAEAAAWSAPSASWAGWSAAG